MDHAPQQAAQTGITHTISTHNTYSDLDMQDKPITGKAGEDTNNKPVEQEDQAKHESGKDSPSTNHHNKKHTEKNQEIVSPNSKNTCIDLSLPSPHDPNTIRVETDVNVVEVSGRMDRGMKEKPINLQDGVTKGRALTHVLHEGEYSNHPRDYRAPATPQNRKNQAQNQHADD
uniref:Uncharacterized protein n=1 Tax=Solanum tuberosum TaxID=4113 RepID=M1DTL3_SOLTU